MVKVLVVCSANISRSQSLAHYLNVLGKEQGLPMVVQSAGVSRAEIEEIYHDQEKYGLELTPSRWVREAMEKPGLATRTPVHLTPARVVTKKMMQWADIVLAVEPKILRKLQTQFPRVASKVRLVTHYSKGRIKNPVARKSALRSDEGLKDAHWPPNKPNPPEYEPGVVRGSEEAKRRLFQKSKGLAESIVLRWKKNLPFSTPRQRRSAKRLARHLQRKQKR